MAENTDNDVGINTNDSPRRLPLGGKEIFGFAIVNQESIVESSRILRALADDLEQGVREAESESPAKNFFPNCANEVLETSNTVLDWLERSAKDLKDMMKPKRHDKIDGKTKDNVGGKQPNSYEDPTKKEGVLRGLYHITDLGSYLCHFGILELVCDSLDLSQYDGNRDNIKREHIKECLKEVNKQHPTLFELVETACDILQEITRDDKFNQGKADAFNSTVRQANVIVESCTKFLFSAEKTIDELMKSMSIIKIASRFLRFVGFCITCCWLYQHTSPSSSSTVDSLASHIPQAVLTGLIWKLVGNFIWEYIGFAASCIVAGYAWLSLFPSRTYALLDDVYKLKREHERLTYSQRGLERRLKVASEDARNSNQQSDREDSV